MPDAFSQPKRIPPVRLATENEQINQLLGGGLPMATITEIIGPECSGRTGIALLLLAHITKSNNVAAWIDAADTLAPESATSCGVALDHLLWVRCGGESKPLHSDRNLAPPGLPLHVTTWRGLPVGGGGSPHPRTEGRGIPEALQGWIKPSLGAAAIPPKRKDLRRLIGTPGAPNRPLAKNFQPRATREEPVNSDRLPPRRGDNLSIAPRYKEAQHDLRTKVFNHSSEALPYQSASSVQPIRETWQAVDQALRAVDLILQGGGFGLIVLDLGSTSQECVWRIPMATWFRFRAACERTRASLLVITQHPCTRSSAELVVHLQAGSLLAQNGVVKGMAFQGITERSRSEKGAAVPAKVVPMRKPPQSERNAASICWTMEAAWTRHG